MPPHPPHRSPGPCADRTPRRWDARVGGWRRRAAGIGVAAFCAWSMPSTALGGPDVPEVSGVHRAAPAHGVLSITLRSSAVIASGAPITLADIATLEGDDRLVEAVGAVIVVPPEEVARRAGEAGLLLLEIEPVRSAVLGSVSPAVASRLVFRGARCGVRLGAAPTPAPLTRTPARAGRGPEYQTLDGTDAGTLRGLIAERLAGHLGVRVADLRLGLGVAGGGDAGMLDAPVAPGWRVEVHPSASPSSASVPMRVDLFEHDRLVRTLHVSSRVQVRRTVLVTRSAIERESTISPDQVVLEERWVTPLEGVGLEAVALEGLVTRRRLEPGRVLSLSDLQAPLAVERGQPVWVHYLGRGVSVKVRARALAPAREGELVRLQIDGRRHVIEARMSGRGTAVMLADPDENMPAPDASPTTPAPVQDQAPQERAAQGRGHAPTGPATSGEPVARTGPSATRSATAGTAALSNQAEDGLTVHQRARLWHPTSVADRQSSSARPR
jgi:flagella basal body P-ring formation protein FlgA